MTAALAPAPVTRLEACRTKRGIHEICDAMTEGRAHRKPYETRLGPRPTDSRVAHADTQGTKE